MPDPVDPIADDFLTKMGAASGELAEWDVPQLLREAGECLARLEGPIVGLTAKQEAGDVATRLSAVATVLAILMAVDEDEMLRGGE